MNYKMTCDKCGAESEIQIECYVPRFNETKGYNPPKVECPKCHTVVSIRRFNDRSDLAISYADQ